MMKRGERGGRVVRVSSDGKHVYMSGVDQPKDREKEDPRSWIDRITIGTGEKKRVWQAAADMYERVLSVRDDDLGSLILSRESKTTIPDSWLLATKNGKLTQLTQNIDPAPGVTGAKRLRLTVTRVDGFGIWVNVSVPRDVRKPLPALLW